MRRIRFEVTLTMKQRRDKVDVLAEEIKDAGYTNTEIFEAGLIALKNKLKA